MEQLRLTLPELEQEEKQIRENLGGIVKNFCPDRLASVQD